MKEGEKVISIHSQERWQRRDLELTNWVECVKPRRRTKQTAWLGNIEVDTEIFGALVSLKRLGLQTEFSCAGVSPLDEPVDHSMYAYITLFASEKAHRFVQFAIRMMKHRLLVTFEPLRDRYDLSSFFIGHNRSFCILLHHCAESFVQWEMDRNADMN
ncbi:hypothetical protein BK138_29840 [Paenibacillus rhizosphaerae]|uniref:Uncharacterized protein n=1 Tax=Paenibacillus rhizosphaerae TaxID=297318 RepID=A0A1R1ECG3_9BACL|nr:hypothetical protein [Paenibacillus rhizosphaerae]OMF49481.1 hypothetical protein BK138_29840 [Paenibacillus rhizosphaerae]